MNKKQKKNLFRIIIATIAVIALEIIKPAGILGFILYLAVYLVIGYDVLLKAFKGIRNKQPFDENLLMAIATVGAIALALYEKSSDYREAIAVMLFYQIGEWFQSYAVARSRKNITDLMDIAPEYANLINEDGEAEETDPEDVPVGSIILCKPGEKVPIDGIILKGSTSVDTKALTGESVPSFLEEGNEIYSGCINLTGAIMIKTTKEYADSTVAKVLELIEEASSKKAKTEKFITRFSRVYTPVVVYLALALMLLPPVVIYFMTGSFEIGKWIYRALTFLVISCPCALVISIPLSFFAGIGCAGKHGILIKGSNYLELLAKMKTVVFDKTGTLTKGNFSVTRIVPVNSEKEELIHFVTHLEKYSDHPVALSVMDAFEKINDECEVTEIEEIRGEGIKALVDGKVTLCGNRKLLDRFNVSFEEATETGTIIYAAVENRYLGYVVISDEIKPEVKETLIKLKKIGVNKTVMLTGDVRKTAEAVAKETGIDEFHAELLPQDKVSIVEGLLSNRNIDKETVAFVGDGINDAPVLTLSDVGIAMGAIGSDAAIEAADVVLMDDDVKKISTALKISGKCLRIVKENIVFAIGVKVICLILGALGLANMWLAVFADVGVMVIAVLNAIRCMFVKE
ncbi:MAG: cadmium-translocating P-type ATPase [Lachnospiraceae bacterium]|nr:cadmium-translocating P-type ATPase [Lachnospiraceae bacterium]